MVVITVEEFPSMPGRFHYSAKDTNTGKFLVVRYSDAGGNPGEAAAKAVGLAMSLRNNESYAIIAAEKVLKHIPDNLRSR